MRMIKKSLTVSALAVSVLMSAVPVQAQVERDALRLFLGSTGSAVRYEVGSGSPEGVVTAPVNSQYVDTSTGLTYRKASGTGNTGWVLSSVLAGASNCVPRFTATSVLACDGTLTSDGSTLSVLPTSGSAFFFAKTGSSNPGDKAGISGTNAGGTTLWRIQGDASSGLFELGVGSSLTTRLSIDFSTGVSTWAANNTVASGVHYLPEVTFTSDLGAAGKVFRTAHIAEMQVQTLVAQDVISTIGGQIIVAPTTILTADLAAGATTMTVKHNSLASGDRVLMQSIGTFEWMSIDSAAGGSAGLYTYTVTRDLDGSGSNNWVIGDAVVNSGTTGDGLIGLYSVGSTAGPTMVFNQRTGTTWSDIASRAAVGNLNGLYGYATDTWGAAFGSTSATNVTVDVTNGFRIRSGTTNKFAADTSGNLSLTGNLTVGTSGLLLSGATDYATGTGYVLDYNGGTPRMRIGTTAGNRLTWDGTTLSVVGTLTASAGTIGGWSIGATSLTAGSGATTVGLDSGGSNPAIYAGSATPGSAPFRVTNAGVLTASSGTVGGWTLSATSLTSGNVGVATSGGYAFWSGNATPASADFYVTDAGFVHMDSGEVGSGSSAITIDSSGLTIPAGSGRIAAGGGSVELNEDGLVFAGTDDEGTRIKWSTSGNRIKGAGNSVRLMLNGGTDEVFIDDGGGGATFFGPSNDNIELGSSGDPWGALFSFVPSTSGTAYYPIVTLSPATTGELAHKTDGTGDTSCAGGQYVDGISADYGIVIGINCSTPVVSPEVKGLQAEVKELRELVQMLLRQQGGVRR